MGKRIFYSKGVKLTIIIVILLSAVLAGITGSWIFLGHFNGMTIREALFPVSYEESQSSSDYLFSEGYWILEYFRDSTLFSLDGSSYDGTVTIDIQNIDAGVSNNDKNTYTTYTLDALNEFYLSDGYVLMQALLDNADTYVINASEVALAEEDGEFYWEISETENILTMETHYYNSLYNALYNNGIAIENKFITNTSGGTLADYAQDNLDTISLYNCYQNLLTAAVAVHRFFSANTTETNVMLYIRGTETGVVYTNIDEWKNLPLDAVKDNYLESYGDENGGVYYYGDEKESVKSTITETAPIANDKYTSSIGDALLENARIFLGNEYYQIFIGLDTNYPVRDSSYYMQQFYQIYMEQRLFGVLNISYVFFAALAIILFFLIIVFRQSGYKLKNNEIQAIPISNFPIEPMILMDVLVWSAIFYLTHKFIYWCKNSISTNHMLYSLLQSQQQKGNILGTAIAVICTLTVVSELIRYGCLIKAHTPGKSMVVDLWQRLKKLKMNTTENHEQRRMVVFYLIFVAVHFIFLILAGSLYQGYYAGLAFFFTLLLAMIDFCVLVLVVKNEVDIEEIKKDMVEIAHGNLDYRIDIESISEDNKVMVEKLNSMRDSLKRAVETEMKNERLKTELITNMSHDIRTPLTSIITYVDILKRENIQDEKINRYIAIIDHKSRRLKQIAEELVEVSKIQSGNITLNMAELDLKLLINQLNGEFEEKFLEKNLEIIYNSPEEKVPFYADGHQMFRILENLYSNIAKYAMQSSRIYITIETEDDKILLFIKNISENQLNFKADELMERFVRGDISRSTEGSGLGLEIARNLTIMQGGTFDLYLDGDLFKVTITFPAIK